ncbi:THO complex subunit 5B [Cynara cardunculus var. scolymus]|uniref:THO complex, subunit 5 n=1 Tax=Cynara cardunculus var. scolymus TaxID=59895 RepID=A0A118JYT6_CYNCS|nr:THO complex subunit 5B [Cynara cardunculus var. scolymus]KVH98332.1 THO complex, subunit 5 [Cynara cardunculus var. scolymus]
MDLNMAEPGEILPDRKIDTSAYDLLHKTRASVEDIVAQMLSVKKEGGGGDSTKSQLPELVTQMLINFVNLRKANRSILLEEDLVKAETEHAKAPVDFTTLQLHNLMYEKNHYVKAIKACKDFKSKYPDIELVPEEDFFRDAPEQIKNSVQSNDSAHDLMLKRLNFELFQRKELSKLHEKMEEQKKILQDTIANRKKFLSSLPSHLKSLKKASLPVQNQLGILHTKKLKQHQSAELLPPPLYVIYSQLLAHKEAFGESIDLEIVGSMKDAHVFARQQANKDNGITSPNIENSKLEDDVPDEEDDGQRRRKRPKKIQVKESLDPARIYQAHPLKLILQVHDDEASDQKSTKLIVLKFEYLLKLNVVCVGIEGSNEGPESNILCNLFPNDAGLELPHQSAKLWSGDGPIFDERRSSRPYKWTQHLAGIDFLPEVSPLLTTGGDSTNGETTKQTAIISGLSLYRQQNRVQTVVQRIRARKKAQMALAEQIDSLTKLKWPALTCRTVPWFSHVRLCSLQSWTVKPPPKPAASVGEQIQVSQEVDMVVEPDTLKAEIENIREDGELPSLNPATTIVNEITTTPVKGSGIEHSKRLALITKSMASPMSKGKSPSFRKHDEDLDLMLLSDSEVDEPPQTEPETDEISGTGNLKVIDNSWMSCGVREYRLLLTRKVYSGDGLMKLEAKINISMEYPLRPPLFTLNLFRATTAGTGSETEANEWFNELRAMEAEVNIHVAKLISWEEENYILGHQVCCLAMLFDFYVNDGASSTEKGKSTFVVDVGLCKPVNGGLVTRTYRGRDHRKMISWKDNGCTPGYPS